MDELFERIFAQAINLQATDIHLTCQNQLKIRFRIYGHLDDYDVLEKEAGTKLLNYLKYLSKINVNFIHQPQTGRFLYEFQEHPYFLRVSFLPGIDFESIVIRILNNHYPLSLNQLSILPDYAAFLKQIIQYTSGLFLIAGATGSGKSTTLYAMIDALLEKGGRHIVTLEDPIEMVKDNVLQIEINEAMGITYQDSLKQILRHDPDVIMIGEIRDEKTAGLALTCALTGHLVLSTIHASTAPLVIKRMINLNINESDLEDVLVGIVAQKIRYDYHHRQIIILPEMLNKKEIQSLLHHQKISYQTFTDQIKTLVDVYHYDPHLFRGDYDA